MVSRKITHSALGLAILFVVSIVRISAAADYPKVPILMVHGTGSTSSSWYYMIRYLRSNGYDDRLLYTIDMSDNYTLCAESHITQISNKVEEIVLESGFNRIDVIGHSRGALNLFDYMRFDNGSNRVRNWISLGGPNNFSCVTNQNPPSDPTPGDQTLYTSIYSTSDERVTPALAIIEGARNIAVDNVSHYRLTLDPVVFPHVLEALQGTGLNDGEGLSQPPLPPTGPEITSIPGTVATVDLLYTYDVEAVDLNPEDILTYSLSTPPAGMTIDADTGLIEWTPANGDVGEHAVEVTVKDDGGLEDTQAFTITVNAAPAEIVVFADSFENGFGNWRQDAQNDWFRSTQRAADGGTYAAEVDGSARGAQLISVPIDLQGRTNAVITFSWYIESTLDSGEYLAFDVSTDRGSTWVEKARLRGNVDQENQWHDVRVDVTLSGLNDLTLRFRGNMSLSNEDANVDEVTVTAW